MFSECFPHYTTDWIADCLNRYTDHVGLNVTVCDSSSDQLTAAGKTLAAPSDRHKALVTYRCIVMQTLFSRGLYRQSRVEAAKFCRSNSAAVSSYPSRMVLMPSVDIKQQRRRDRQLPVHNSPYGLCGRKGTKEVPATARP